MNDSRKKLLYLLRCLGLICLTFLFATKVNASGTVWQDKDPDCLLRAVVPAYKITSYDGWTHEWHHTMDFAFDATKLQNVYMKWKANSTPTWYLKDEYQNRHYYVNLYVYLPPPYSHWQNVLIKTYELDEKAKDAILAIQEYPGGTNALNNEYPNGCADLLAYSANTDSGKPDCPTVSVE